MAKIRMGMVGGGEGAFIGVVHRMAAAIDGDIELVCGAFSADPERSLRSGLNLQLPAQRIYADYQQMMLMEAGLLPEQRMQFVVIVTPNHLHFPVAKSALEAGFHVLSDKPATLTYAEALALSAIVESNGLIYGLTHTYTGYPMIKEARARVGAGELGKIRKVMVEYPQGWLATAEDELGNKQAAWRLDPQKAGSSGCIADIGVHGANLAEYVSGLQISEICADLTAFVEGRVLDDDGSILLRFEGGAKGLLMASQVCSGEENALKIRVYGDKGGLEWSQQEPNTLWLKWPDRPTQMLRAGADYLGQDARHNTRLPMGHPEGYLEAFANLYRAFAAKIKQAQDTEEGTESAAGENPALSRDCPGIDEALRGMAFIELAVASSASEVKWHKFETGR